MIVLGKNAYSQKYVYSNADDGFLNIRKEANAKSEIIGVLYNGKEGALLIDDSNSYWYKVKKDKITGFVNKRYAKLEAGSTTSVVKTSSLDHNLSSLQFYMTTKECEKLLGAPSKKDKYESQGNHYEHWEYKNKAYLIFLNNLLVQYSIVNSNGLIVTHSPIK